jgi:hypothetical protein
METGVRYTSSDPLAELYAMMKRRAAPVSNARYTLAASGLTGAPLRELNRLAALRGRALSHLPEAAILTVRGAGRDRHFSLIANRAHSNVAELFDEADRRLPAEDRLLVTNDFIPAYPNGILRRRGCQAIRVRRCGGAARLRVRLFRADGRLRHPAHGPALLAAQRRSAPRLAAIGAARSGTLRLQPLREQVTPA